MPGRNRDLVNQSGPAGRASLGNGEDAGKGPRYEDIIKSSIEVFSRTNYEKATTAMLAREAGVAEGTLYKYFSSKKELFLACYRYVGQLLIERYTRIYRETKDSPREYLRRVAGSYLDFLKENPSMRRFLAFVLNNSFDQDFLNELKGFIDLNIQATESMIRKALEKGELRNGLDPRSAAWFFVGGYFTLILMTELDAEEARDPAFIDNLLVMILN
jgi:AcrR family transcriptional regulator